MGFVSKLLAVGLSAITAWFRHHQVPVETGQVEKPGSELLWARCLCHLAGAYRRVSWAKWFLNYKGNYCVVII